MERRDRLEAEPPSLAPFKRNCPAARAYAARVRSLAIRPAKNSGYRHHSCRVEGRRVAGRASVALPALSPRAAVRRPWVRFLPPLSGRVESWRAAGRVRWLLRRFRTGPQSGSRGHVSSSRLVKPSMPISGTGLSCCLRLKGYAAVQTGSAFGR